MLQVPGQETESDRNQGHTNSGMWKHSTPPYSWLLSSGNDHECVHITEGLHPACSRVKCSVPLFDRLGSAEQYSHVPLHLLHGQTGAGTQTQGIPTADTSSTSRASHLMISEGRVAAAVAVLVLGLLPPDRLKRSAERREQQHQYEMVVMVVPHGQRRLFRASRARCSQVAATPCLVERGITKLRAWYQKSAHLCTEIAGCGCKHVAVLADESDCLRQIIHWSCVQLSRLQMDCGSGAPPTRVSLRGPTDFRQLPSTL